MDRPQAVKLIADSLDELFAKDSYLITKRVNERSITTRLWGNIVARVAVMNLHNIDVDHEYNKDVTQGVRHPKSVKIPNGKGGFTTSRTAPDIICHERGINDRNLLVIEFKVNATKSSSKRDFAKLCAFTEDTPQNRYKYPHGAFINVIYRKGQLSYVITWFSEGQEE